MASLTFEGSLVTSAPGETVLEALLKSGAALSSACRAGVCQTCMIQVTDGRIPAEAQKELSPALKAQGYALACVCVPQGPMTIVRAGAACRRIEATIVSTDRLLPDIIRLRLAPEAPFPYRSGQFLTLETQTGIIRNYSIASRSWADDFVELHIRLRPDGRMSRFLDADMTPRDRVYLSGPFGSSFYTGIDPDRPLILVGTGTGLAPLWGILRDALMQGHRGPIRLYHGARGRDGLYLAGQIEALAETHDNLTYSPCVRSDESGDLAACVAATETDVGETVFFLCGSPVLVQSLKRTLFLKGAKLDRLRADAFLPARSSST